MRGIDIGRKGSNYRVKKRETQGDSFRQREAEREREREREREKGRRPKWMSEAK